ncbi:hypothetical protein HanRHA438_Chr08g0344801 [Helianthus annuus]|uniref:Uncharacterized protein n=1 Tax=Helianthus annuus TaxID=4232 RepID=A0A251U4H7_HELAN|nr:hypothetical protein HanXRQr2_Chr08g0333431 [Helianthus annuus]KAJ0538472.1 hypothetical protein HanHA300_Chr08g0275371 [Helianthus annuus]KAJ0546360.1 hypothetical protein HanIR_Chr08g0360071 [Helianthus annuus]KAJ0553102.1 hypothetical protein HanHA89_Chr08g0292691 [Helianthus annuus]KAJ0722019.1 hypothetical protein HanOQP8_Chr08g0282001 [Helianthus annuus]
MGERELIPRWVEAELHRRCSMAVVYRRRRRGIRRSGAAAHSGVFRSSFLFECFEEEEEEEREEEGEEGRSPQQPR